ncbi:DUF6065 family protein [Sphingomonas sp.]|uniref:DUF6065 family protein n=1 Tax=Sphingomonas sp. TaxID=28214 RepID=UPI0025F61E65|nr:DUF6065 family protein [Sphingomonas sp.]MBV9528830.1 hypothetical protein [Sphingomonas sp.]
MAESTPSTICRFFRLIPGAPAPQRADRSAHGTLPVHAYRYCEAIASASAFGWYMFPPLTFTLIWDGVEIFWTYEGAASSYPLRDAAQFPHFTETFARSAPTEEIGKLAPTFLAQGKMPGTVQIWSGYLAKTAPGWALLSRGVSNVPKLQPYQSFEGIIESDSWLGPIFTNIRLTRTHTPIVFSTKNPLFQLQPLRHECYRQPSFAVEDISDLNTEDWDRFAATMVPNTDQNRAPGHYAVDTRRRLRSKGHA